MSWSVDGNSLEMAVGDFGVELPLTVHGITMSEQDTIGVVIKSVNSEEPIIEKTFTAVQDNTVQFMLTAEESARLPAGNYRYRLDWYRDGVFMNNIVKFGSFKVVKKA